MGTAKYGRKFMFRKIKGSLYFKYSLISLRALKVVRDKEGEREVFKHLKAIQRIRLFSPKNLITRGLGYQTPDVFSEALSQKLFKESLDTGLSSLVMISRCGYKKSLLIPYPKPWRQYLNTIGLKPHFLSSLLFLVNIIYKLREGITELGRLYKYNLKDFSKIQDHISFIGVPENALLESPPTKPLYNFLTYAQSKFSEKNILFESSINTQINDKSFQCTYPFLSLTETKEKTLFIVSAIWKGILSILPLMLGHWAYAYMFKDTLISSYVKRLRPTRLPQKIIFLNSFYIYKPLWAIELEKKGVEVALLFYATNTYDLQLEDSRTYGMIPGYAEMTWKKFYTLHNNHKEFLEKTVKRKISVSVETKPFSLTDYGSPLNLPLGPKIALFDVQPFRDAFLASIGRPTNIYTSDISEKIFSDLYNWCEENKVYLIIKPKRDVRKRLCPRYASLIGRYKEKEFCFFADSLFSPIKICQEVDAIICQPFTSAALFAVEGKKPVVYYDPISPFILEQPANQGISLIRTPAYLYNFLNKVVLQ